jgi:hypothetical protein
VSEEFAEGLAEGKATPQGALVSLDAGSCARILF